VLRSRWRRPGSCSPPASLAGQEAVEGEHRPWPRRRPSCGGVAAGRIGRPDLDSPDADPHGRSGRRRGLRLAAGRFPVGLGCHPLTACRCRRTTRPEPRCGRSGRQYGRRRKRAAARLPARTYQYPDGRIRPGRRDGRRPGGRRRPVRHGWRQRGRRGGRRRAQFAISFRAAIGHGRPDEFRMGAPLRGGGRSRGGRWRHEFRTERRRRSGLPFLFRSSRRGPLEWAKDPGACHGHPSPALRSGGGRRGAAGPAVRAGATCDQAVEEVRHCRTVPGNGGGAAG